MVLNPPWNLLVACIGVEPPRTRPGFAMYLLVLNPLFSEKYSGSRTFDDLQQSLRIAELTIREMPNPL